MNQTVQLYNGKYTLEFNENAHRYKVNGEYKYGVTTMLKVIDKGEGLGQWMANMAVEALVAGASPTEAKRAWRKKRDKAGDIGTKVHEWIENYTNTGEKGEVTEEMKDAVEAFLRWEEQNNIKHLHTERLVYSETFDYCGTVDDVHEQNGVRVVNDYKTGKPDFEYNPRTRQYTGKVRPRIEHLLQCALYDQAMYEEDGVVAHKYGVTYITKEGKLYYFETDRTEEIRKLALRVVGIHNPLKEEEKLNEYVEVA